MIEDEKAIEKRYKAGLGLLTTAMFITFAIMHISLSVEQYNVSRMNKFNQAVTYSLFPDIDTKIPLSPKQWTNKATMNDYFTKEVGKSFQGASYNSNITYFHEFNHLLPNMKITKILSQKIDCGSTVSNWIGKNNAKLNNKPYPSVGYGYPFQEDECYGTYEDGRLED